MLEHLTSGSMLKDLSTNKIPKIWKGHLIQTQQQSTLFLLYSGKHSLKKLAGKHFKNKNRAEMYVKNEKLLLFYFKLSISIEMLEILKNYLKHSFQVLFLLKKHYCLKIHRSSKNRKRKMYVYPDLWLPQFMLKKLLMHKIQHIYKTSRWQQVSN